MLELSRRFWQIVALLGSLICFPAFALQPQEIVVIANQRVKEGLDLAAYYMSQRSIPQDRLLTVKLGREDTLSRQDYVAKLVRPLREFVTAAGKKTEIRCLLVMHGIPLKVDAPELTEEEEKLSEELDRQRDHLQKRLQVLDSRQSTTAEQLRSELETIESRRKNLQRFSRRAALDSELTLVLADDYPLSGWVPNPYFVGFKDKKGLVDKSRVLMVSRLDGPRPDIVRRMIDDSLAAEKNGLEGIAYFDARWPQAKEKNLTGYELYDHSIHLAAENLGNLARLPVVLDQQEKLFLPGQCPKAALYCGWYSLANYIAAFQWQKGAVGYHIASAECTTLTRPGSQIWCKRMLEEGAAATLGPVDEPYVQAFPLPEVFFPLLAEGYLTLAECYQVSLPYLSWKMVLLGDPMYKPFKPGIPTQPTHYFLPF
jgi:uncharacterized protein (TIGR03790 family)